MELKAIKRGARTPKRWSGQAMLLGFAAVLWLLGSPFGRRGYAASMYKKSLAGKHQTYAKDGVFIGGYAGAGASLLGVRHGFSAKSQLERIMVELGDKDGKPPGEKMGYFQVSLDSANRRLVVDVAQLRLSKVSESDLRHLFKNSPYVQSVEFSLDPEDKGATLVLNLKIPVRLEAYHQHRAKSPGEIVMDLLPLGKPGGRG